MGIKELSLELAAVSLIADEAKKAKDRLRAALQTEMDKIGADRVKAEYGEDVIAYVTTSKPKFKWVVKNDKEFVKWVKANIPSEIVETVRESSIDAILDKFHYINGDDVIAYVTTSKPKFKWIVKNDKEFVKWVKANIPSEIVETVRESSIDAILDKFHYINGDDVIDPNGERVEWLIGRDRKSVV